MAYDVILRNNFTQLSQIHKYSHKHKLKEALLVASSILVVIWTVHLLQWFTPLRWTHYGILPLRYEGLKGVFLSPFLHSQDDWFHIINNSATLFAGIVMLFYFYTTVATRVLVYIYLFSGISVWIIAGLFVESKYAYHIGASGIVYGLIAFIFWSGVFRKNARALILALIMILMYSGMVVGLFPDAEGKVSWQSHLAGAIFGMVLAYQYKDVIEWDELQSYEQPTANPVDKTEEKHRYFEADVFDKTIEERWWDAQIQRREKQLYMQSHRAEDTDMFWYWITA